MNKKITAPRPTSKTILAASLSLALGIGGVSLAAQSASAAESAQAATVQSSIDDWTVTLTKTATDIDLYETINGQEVITGWSPLVDIAADQAIADGDGVEGIESSGPDGLARLKVIGQAGADVAAVSVTTPTGRTIEASIEDGIWLAAWQGEYDPDSPDFTLTYTTTSGETRTAHSSAFGVQD